MIKKLLTVFLISFFCFSLVTCRRWRLTTLKPQKISFIKSGNKIGEVAVQTDKYGLKDLSFNIKFFHDKICLTDNLLKRIQIMNYQNETELIIGSTKNIKDENTKIIDFNFSILGLLDIDKNKNIYIQNKFPQAEQKSSSLKDSNQELIFSPSYILVFDKEGKLQYTLGQEGISSIPFYDIEKISVDNQGRLFVVSKSFETFKIFCFQKNKRILTLNLDKLNFNETDYKSKIENVQFFKDQDQILVSVAFYYNLRLKYRKIITYSILERKILKTIMKIPDPKNVLFNLEKDQFIYLWNIEEKNEAKFIVYNMEGNIINNVLLDLKNYNSYYSKITTDSLGSFFSYYLTPEGIQILKWKE